MTNGSVALRPKPASPILVTIVRLGLVVLAIGLVVWGLLDPHLRTPEGLIAGRSAFSFGAAGACLILALGAGTSCAATARWSALLVVAQASALQLIFAGPRVAYQHFLTPLALVSTRWSVLHLLVIVVQALVCLFALLRSRHTKRNPFALIDRTIWTPSRVGVVVFIMLVFSSTFSRSPVDFAAELLLATSIQAIALLNVLLAVAALPDAAISAFAHHIERILGVAAQAGKQQPRLDRFAWIGALWTTAVAVLLVCVVYQRHPHVPDEVVYLKHAAYFAKGMIALPLPPVPKAFDIDLMYFGTSQWFSPVPPGWPAVLAVGSFFGVPWLVNPVLAGINVLLSYLLAQELFDRRIARIAVILLCVSPWHLFMAMNFMTHTVSMTCALLAALLTTQMRRDYRWWRALVAGGAIGMTSLVRPLEGLAVALLLGFWTLLGPGKVIRVKATMLLALGAIAIGALTLPYNTRLTGSATTFPIMMYVDKYYPPHSNDLGFGANRGMGWPGLDPLPGHGLPDVLINADFNTFAINVELFGWAIGSLLPVVLVLFGRRMDRTDKLLWVVIATIAGIHSFYWFSGGPDFGARYWYLVLLPCMLLTARAMRLLPRRLNPLDANSYDPVSRNRLLIGLALLSMSALVTFMPWRSLDKYHYYRGMRPDLRDLSSQTQFGRSLILVRGNRHPDYASAAIYNPLDLHADAPIYAWDRDASTRAAVLAAYPDRKVWIVDGPTVTGSGYRVVRGPIPASQLLVETQHGKSDVPDQSSTPGVR
ncbi:MAG: glycosyltransferase family 39 protein [Gemmatimonadaceae bacterium]